MVSLNLVPNSRQEECSDPVNYLLAVYSLADSIFLDSGQYGIIVYKNLDFLDFGHNFVEVPDHALGLCDLLENACYSGQQAVVGPVSSH